MMQSTHQTKGSTLRNGIRHDAVVREIPSAATVLFLDEFGMTHLYATLSPTAHPATRLPQSRNRTDPFD